MRLSIQDDLDALCEELARAFPAIEEQQRLVGALRIALPKFIWTHHPDAPLLRHRIRYDRAGPIVLDTLPYTKR